ncbi:hypothetical protein AMECASPLE_031121 [Ameca splendens]|uniref:Secreted protein n=1 Tax=Ameca splendens TaxID=208324 RepID=A0ABV0YID6_9TELE
MTTFCIQILSSGVTTSFVRFSAWISDFLCSGFCSDMSHGTMQRRRISREREKLAGKLFLHMAIPRRA